MNRVLRALMIILCFEMGALLLYLPWTNFWEQNYFLSHFPSLLPVLLHPSVRGFVSGIGVLDIFLAFGLIRPRPESPSCPLPVNFQRAPILCYVTDRKGLASVTPNSGTMRCSSALLWLLKPALIGFRYGRRIFRANNSLP